MNKITLVGRMVRKPETRYAQSAELMAVTRVSVAVNRPYRKDKQQEADFFNCVAFGKRGEYIEKYGDKGRLVSIVGTMRQGTWEKDGEKHTSWDVIVEELNFLDKYNGSSETGTEQPTQSNPPNFYDDDDLPF